MTIKQFSLNGLIKKTTVLSFDEAGVYVGEGFEQDVVPFADVRGDIERELERVKTDEAYAAWVARLKGQSYVKVFDTNPF